MLDPGALDFLDKLIKLITSAGALGTALYRFVRGRREAKTKWPAEELICASNLTPGDKTLVLEELNRLRRAIRALLIALAIVGVVLLASFYLPARDRSVLSSYLAKHDPDVFSNSKDGLYDIARVFPDRQSLERETDLGTTLRDTKHTFDMVAINARVVMRLYREQMLNAIRRGVRFRIALLDPDERNKTNFDVFARAVGHDPEFLRQEAKLVEREITGLQSMISNDKTTYKGSLEVRWLDETLLYTMWLKDRDTEIVVGHLGVPLYRGDTYWPSFRFSRDSSKLIQNLEAEFDHAWDKSRPLE